MTQVLLNNHIFFSSDINKERNKYERLVRRHGGVVRSEAGPTCIHVFVAFEGEEFEEIKSNNYTVLSLDLFNTHINENTQLPDFQPGRNAFFNTLLSNVIITTTGLQKNTRDKVFLLAQYMSARTSTEYIQTVTHLIAVTSGSPKYDMAVQKNAKIVTPQWIFECWEKKKYLTETSFTLPKVNHVELLPEPSNSPPVISSCKDMEKNKNVKNVATTFVKKESVTPDIFKDIYFLARGFESDIYEDLCQIIQTYGGFLFKDIKQNQVLPYVHYTLVPHGWKSPLKYNKNKESIDIDADKEDSYYQEPDNFDQFCANTPLVTPNWLERCIQENQILEPQSFILFSPLPREVPYPNTRKTNICITGFNGIERKSIRMLIIVLGFKYNEKLTQKINILICKSPNGVKCSYANMWDIPVVNEKWIIHCSKEGKILPYFNFQFPASILPTPSNIKHISNSMSSVPSQNNPPLLGVTLYVSKTLKSSKEKYYQTAATLGACSSLKLNDSVTHVIHSGKSETSSELRGTKLTTWQIVSPMWLQACKDNHRWMNEKDYPCYLNPRMALGTILTLQPAKILTQSKKRPLYRVSSDSKLPLRKKRKTIISLFREREEEEIANSTPLPTVRTSKSEIICSKRNSSSFSDFSTNYSNSFQQQQQQTEISFIPPPNQTILLDNININTNNDYHEISNVNPNSRNIFLQTDTNVSNNFDERYITCDKNISSNDNNNYLNDYNNNKIIKNEVIVNENHTKSSNNNDFMEIDSNTNDFLSNNNLDENNNCNSNNFDQNLNAELSDCPFQKKVKREEEEYLAPFPCNENTLNTTTNNDNNDNSNKLPSTQDKADEKTKQVLSKLEQLLGSTLPSTTTVFNTSSIMNEQDKENTPNKAIVKITLDELENCTPMSKKYNQDEHFGDIGSDSDNNNGEIVNDFDKFDDDDDEINDSQIVVYNTKVYQSIPNSQVSHEDHDYESLGAESELNNICKALNNFVPSNNSSDNNNNTSNDYLASNITHQSESPKLQFVFAFSLMSPEKKQEFSAVVLHLGGDVVEMEEDFASITHVICGKLTRSSKLLAAVAGGKWVLQPSFMEECTNEQKWVNERPHEWNEVNCPGEESDLITVPRRWRRTVSNFKRNGKSRPAFYGMCVALWIVEHKVVLQIILEQGGAKVIAEHPPYDTNTLNVCILELIVFCLIC